MTRTVLGIAGRKGTGKTTLAKALEEQGWIRLAFADPVKELALTLDPWVITSDEDGDRWRLSEEVAAWGWDIAKQNDEVRRILQVVGTELGRAFDTNIWINKMAERVYRLPSDAKVVIDDVRFINECNWIRHAMHGKVVRLNGKPSGDGHQSEAEVDRLDPNLDIDVGEFRATLDDLESVI